jgi:hypothetical protein
MWEGSYLVSEVKAATAKNPLQPWVGILIIGLSIGGFIFLGDIKGSFMKLFQSAPTELVNSSDEGKNNEEGNDSTNAADQEVVIENQPVEPEVVVNPEVFTCFDGTIIPMGYLNDGGCDCPNTCEDENFGD